MCSCSARTWGISAAVPRDRGLAEELGLARCFDTPIGEAGIVAVAIGMGAYGLRPVAEIQFADYIYPAYDQIASGSGAHPVSQRRLHTPITIRTPYGGGIFGGRRTATPEHCSRMSQASRRWFRRRPRRQGP